jgi:flagellar M-ring protein FliF
MPSNFLGQLNSLNEKLTLNQKLSIGALSTVILLGTLVFVYLVQQQHYQLVFSNLDAENARAVIGQLDQLDVPYQLSDGGKSLSVPPDRVDEVRIEIASQGLPTSGRIGFELFDQNNWGITDFAEKVNYRRALEGELEKTLLGLAEISSARVHLVMEKDSLFEEESQPAKASVVIRLRDREGLAPKRIQGVQNLVAFSVEGLQPENVTLVDVHGNLLSQVQDSKEMLTDAELSHRNKIEQELAQKVVSILEPLVGENKVRVTASVQLDRVEMQENEELFDPDRTVIRSQQRTEEFAGDGAVAQGIPFRANDAGQGGGNPPANSGKSRQANVEVVNYEISKTIRSRRTVAGGIKNISMAVVVDDKISTTQDAEGNSVETPAPRSPEEMERLRSLVASTIGFTEGRDALTVENISFMKVVEEPVTLPDPSLIDRYQGFILQGLRYFSVVVLFLLFYFLVFRPVRKKVFSYVEVSSPDLKQLASSAENPELARLLEQGLPQASGENQLALSPNNLQGTLDQAAAARKQLVDLAQKDPSLVSQMIRSWLSEGA